MELPVDEVRAEEADEELWEERADALIWDVRILALPEEALREVLSARLAAVADDDPCLEDAEDADAEDVLLGDSSNSETSTLVTLVEPVRILVATLWLLGVVEEVWDAV